MIEDDKCYKKSTREAIKELKCHVPFLDETFSLSSSVRAETKISRESLLDEIFISSVEKERISNEKRSIRKALRGQKRIITPITDSRYLFLTHLLDDAAKKASSLKKIFTKTYPLSSKLVVDYSQEKQVFISRAFDSLSTKEREKVKVVRDGELVSYATYQKPLGTNALSTQLEPYYAAVQIQAETIMSTLLNMKRRLEASSYNAFKNRQIARRKQTEYKIRKINHFISVIERIVSRIQIYGKSLKGVKMHVRLNGQLHPWPKYLIGEFIPVSTSSMSFNSSLLSAHTVVNPASGEVPFVSFDTLHLFCKNKKDTLEALGLLTEHEVKKFSAFSHYELSMSPEYPIKNSIGFPFDY